MFINHWISTLNISCLYPEWHFFKWYCQLQFGIGVLFCKNKLLSNLTEIERFAWRKGFWMAFGSDLVSENKLSSKVVIQSPQTEKPKGIWLKKRVWNCPILSTSREKQKWVIIEISNWLARLMVNEPLMDVFLNRNCSCTAHTPRNIRSDSCCLSLMLFQNCHDNGSLPLFLFSPPQT